MEALTKAQRRALQLAVDSGGEIQIGGLDGQRVRLDLLSKLHDRGFFKIGTGPQPWITLYKITELGRDAIQTERKSVPNSGRT